MPTRRFDPALAALFRVIACMSLDNAQSTRPQSSCPRLAVEDESEEIFLSCSARVVGLASVRMCEGLNSLMARSQPGPT